MLIKNPRMLHISCTAAGGGQIQQHIITLNQEKAASSHMTLGMKMMVWDKAAVWQITRQRWIHWPGKYVNYA